MPEFFPENDKGVAQRILRDGITLYEPSDDYTEVMEYLSNAGIIGVENIEFVKCSNEIDDDFPDREVLDCPGSIPITGDDLYCNECGRPIDDVHKKEKFERRRVTFIPEGINNYVGKCFMTLDIVEVIEQPYSFVYKVQISSGSLLVVIPPFAEVNYLSSGLFFGEPTLYILPSNIYHETRSVLEELQFLDLAELVSESKETITERVILAATPIAGRQNLSDLENQFDEMLERYADRRWQFFEQDFIPALVNYLAQNPAKAQDYLKRLRRLDQTIFGEFHVPIGGAEHTDLRPVNKFSVMNQLLEGNKIGDAKCHRKSSLDYNDIGTINLHLDRDHENDVAVIFIANDRIRPNAWNTVLDLKSTNDGRWKIIILTKHLLLELISSIDAVHLLEM